GCLAKKEGPRIERYVGSQGSQIGQPTKPCSFAAAMLARSTRSPAGMRRTQSHALRWKSFEPRCAQNGSVDTSTGADDETSSAGVVSVSDGNGADTASAGGAGVSTGAGA